MMTLTHLLARLRTDCSLSATHDAVCAALEELQTQAASIDGLRSLLTTALDEADNRYLSQRGVNAVNSATIDALVRRVATLELERDAPPARSPSPVDKLEARVAELTAEIERLNMALRGAAREATQLRDELASEKTRLCNDIVRLTAELDESNEHRRKESRVELQTVEAIARCLESRAAAILAANSGHTRAAHDAQHRAAGLTDAVDALRAGTWKEGDNG